jgi:soluble cytochrome b562
VKRKTTLTGGRMARARPRTQTRIDDSVVHELGRMAEAIENSKDDRAEMREEARAERAEMRDEVRDLKDGFGKLTSAIDDLAVEKCGERLDIIERDRSREAKDLEQRLVKFEGLIAQSDSNTRAIEGYKRFFGTGANLFIRVAIALLGSTAGGALIAKFWH